MAERPNGHEGVATSRADVYMAGRKERTRKWWRRGFAGLATSVLAFAAAVGTFYIPPVSLAFFITSVGAAAVGVVSAAIGTGSAIDNSLKIA